jgi:hypothetical protein
VYVGYLINTNLFYGRQEAAVQGLPREEVIRVVREALLPLQQDFNQKGQESRFYIDVCQSKVVSLLNKGAVQ